MKGILKGALQMKGNVTSLHNTNHAHVMQIGIKGYDLL